MKNKISLFLFSTFVLCAALFYACGDDASKLIATADPATGTSILVTDKIFVTFSHSMNKTTLELGGSMSADSDGGVWSKATLENDTLTISPTTTWDTSAPGTLTIDVKDTDGTAITTLSLSYVIKIKLTSFQAASVVIGQTSFTSSDGGPTATTLSNPVGSVIHNAGKLYAPDYGNNRVLIYNSVPTANHASANLVLGQVNLTTSVSGAAANQLSGPIDVKAYKNKLFVADHENNRVLIWNTIPASNDKPADVVLGQSAFGLNASGCAANMMGHPYGLAVVDDKLIVVDQDNSRILIWNSIPTTNGKNADIVLGQNSFTTCAANDDNQDGASDATPSQRTLDGPQGVWSDGTKLVVVDTANNRILIWNTFPTTKFKKADLVLGQGDFTHFADNDTNQDGASDATPSAKTFNFSGDDFVVSNGAQLFATDTNNNRVLVWETFPTTNFAPATVVLGQGDFTHYIPYDTNQDGLQDTPAAKTISYPDGISLFGNSLIVTDDGVGRYLIYTGQ